MTVERTSRDGGAAPPEVYLNRANPAVEASFATRTAAVEAAFFLPYLRPGMALLDCGSGPGSITCDLAEVVAPGEVVGLDIQPPQVEQACTLASERGLTNARFEVGSVYALPFADNSFDAVFAHMLLMHLRDPLAALRELQRVLKPGGVAGIADIDVGIECYSPALPFVEAMQTLSRRWWEHNGVITSYARHQRWFLAEAGFARSVATAEFVFHGAGTLAKTRERAAHDAARLRGPEFQATVIGQGWATAAELDAMCAELLAWGERPDAFFLLARCMAVGWNAGQPQAELHAEVSP
jgi:ubiquinone/menaquinone biosynthesis C-methylase UbiE